MYYVCDRCGHLETRDAMPEDTEWICAECGDHAGWEYQPDKRHHAQMQAMRIIAARTIFIERTP